MDIKNTLNKITNSKVIKSVLKIFKVVFLTIEKIVNSINQNRIYNKSAELAYYLVIGILTILATVVYAAHFVPNLIQTVDIQVLSLLPENIEEVILNALLEIRMPKSISVIILTSITSIWFVSRAVHSIMISLNQIYNVKDHKIGIKSKVISIVFTLALIAMFLLLFVFNIIQASLAELAEKHLHWSMDFFLNNQIWKMLISASVLLLIFNSLYYYLPDKKLKWYYSVPGAVFATSTWIIMSRGFTLYITSISNFTWILGSFGSIFVFLIWVYYSALFLLIGAIINSTIMKRVEAKKRIAGELDSQ